MAHAVVLIALGAIEDFVERVADFLACLAAFLGDLGQAVFAGFCHQPIAPARQVTPSVMMRLRASASSLSWSITSLTSARSCSVRVGSSRRQTSSASAAAFSN